MISRSKALCVKNQDIAFDFSIITIGNNSEEVLKKTEMIVMLLIFGLDEQGKAFKKAMLQAGTDKKLLKQWLVYYKKMKKNQPAVVNTYHQVKEHSQRILSEAEELERMLAEHRNLNDQEKSRFKEILADYEKTAPLLDFEFVVGKADKEILLTMETLPKLGRDFLDGQMDPLIMQSEAENLIALVKEALEKEKPDLAKLSVFYLNHKDGDLLELSHSGQLMRIDEVYREEYLEPVLADTKRAMEQGLLPGDNAETYLNEMCRI